MTPIDKDRVMQFVEAEEWMELCEFLRQWFLKHCPRYERDKIEEIIHARVAGLVITAQQGTEPDRKGRRHTEQDIRDMLRQRVRLCDQDYPTYLRHCARIDGTERAEARLRDVISRMRARREKAGAA